MVAQEGPTRITLVQDDMTLEKLIRIHLLVSVHPDNEAPKPQDKNNKDFEVLLLNPKYHEFFALIRQIAVIHPCSKNDERKDK